MFLWAYRVPRESPPQNYKCGNYVVYICPYCVTIMWYIYMSVLLLWTKPHLCGGERRIHGMWCGVYSGDP